MTDTPPKPIGRRWLVVLCIVASVATVYAWVRSTRRAVLQRAEGLYIGQTISEVERVMGSSGYAQYVAPVREIRLFGLERSAKIYPANAVEALGGKAAFVPTNDQWPVTVHFDPRTGRVFRIKKGDVWLGTTSVP